MAPRDQIRRLYEDEDIQARDRDLVFCVVVQGDSTISFREVAQFARDHSLHACLLGFHRYVLFGSDQWREKVLSQGSIQIKGRPFLVLPGAFDLDPRASPASYWVRICNIPYGWRTLKGVCKLVDFGQVSRIDFASHAQCDLRWVRAHIEVGHRDLIPELRWYELVRATGAVELAEVRFVVEEEHVGLEYSESIKKQELLIWTQDDEDRFNHLLDNQHLNRRSSGIEIRENGENSKKKLGELNVKDKGKNKVSGYTGMVTERKGRESGLYSFEKGGSSKTSNVGPKRFGSSFSTGLLGARPWG